MVKGNDIISEDKEVAKEFKQQFSNAVKELNIDYDWQPTSEITGISDPIDKLIETYKDHPSIRKINEHIQTPNPIEFTEVSEESVLEFISKFDTSKATTFKNIPGKLLKEYAQTYYKSITKLVNKTVVTTEFPEKLKLADLNPTFKKDSRNAAKNYRPISVLPYVSKLYERIFKEQIQTNVDSFLSPYLCGYRKGFSAQHALISMIEKWKKSVDNKGFAGAVLMDLSKAFDCLNHDLLLAKLNAYGFTKEALKTIQSYLKNRWQRVKIDNTFSDWFDLDLGVPQGSVLGPLLFNIYIY